MHLNIRISFFYCCIPDLADRDKRGDGPPGKLSNEMSRSKLDDKRVTQNLYSVFVML